MWILIITVFSLRNDVAITHIDGFTSNPSCMEAGRMASRDILREPKTVVRYQCVLRK